MTQHTFGSLFGAPKIIFCLLLLMAQMVLAREVRVNVTPHYRNNHNLNWSMGLKVGLQSETILSKSLEFSAEYSSSRLGSGLLAPNVIVGNLFLGGVTYFFREGRYISPFIGLKGGYFFNELTSDEEEIFGNVLTTSSFIVLPTFGVQSNFYDCFSIYGSAGYHVIQESNLVFPLTYSIGLTYAWGL
ncbi:MAG: hypothetical protein OCC49_10850 [Fibrobacterales bacterium]